jgi:hypothetical protein
MRTVSRRSAGIVAACAVVSFGLMAVAPAQAVVPSRTPPACTAGAKAQSDLLKSTAKTFLANEKAVKDAAYDAYKLNRKDQALKDAYYAAKAEYSRVSDSVKSSKSITSDAIKAAKETCKLNGGTYTPVAMPW